MMSEGEITAVVIIWVGELDGNTDLAVLPVLSVPIYVVVLTVVVADVFVFGVLNRREVGNCGVEVAVGFQTVIP